MGHYYHTAASMHEHYLEHIYTAQLTSYKDMQSRLCMRPGEQGRTRYTKDRPKAWKQGLSSGRATIFGFGGATGRDGRGGRAGRGRES